MKKKKSKEEIKTAKLESTVTNRPMALKHCANWNAGKCLGVLFIRGEDSGQIFQKVHKDYYGHECFVDSKEGCAYFKNCVRPVLV